MILFYFMLFYPACRIRCEEILLLEICEYIDFIKIFHYIYKVQWDWGDPRKLSANDPECIHHAKFANLMFIIRLIKIIVRQIGKCDFISFFDLIVSSEKLTPQFFKNLINRLGFWQTNECCTLNMFHVKFHLGLELCT